MKTLSAIILFLTTITALRAQDTDVIEAALQHRAASPCAPADVDSLRSLLTVAGATGGPTGLWELTESGATMAVTPEDDGIFYFTLVDSPDRTMRPGTVLGAVRRAAAADVFEGVMFTSSNDGIPSDAARFTARLSDGGNVMVFSRPGLHLRFNPFGLLPYPVRRAVSAAADRTNAPKGAVRVFPHPTSAAPLTPATL